MITVLTTHVVQIGENYLYVFKGARSAPRADGATSPHESTTQHGKRLRAESRGGRARRARRKPPRGTATPP